MPGCEPEYPTYQRNVDRRTGAASGDVIEGAMREWTGSNKVMAWPRGRFRSSFEYC
jgi:hypothetical protein